MAKKAYIGVADKAREVKKIYIGVNGVARKVKKGYIGVAGVARLFYSSGLPLGELPVGSLVSLNESGSPVNFYVAKHDYESGLNGAGRTLLVRKDCAIKMPVSGTYDDDEGYYIPEYASGRADTWMNNTYKSTLDSEIQTAIGTTKFYYTKHVDGDSAGKLTTLSRGIFMLSLNEYGELGGTNTSANVEGSILPIADTLKVAKYDNTLVHHWTRSKATHVLNLMWYLSYIDGGGRTTSAGNTSTYIRPAFTLPAVSTVNSTPNADGSYTLTI